jgi:hypothetical protein
VCSGSIFNTSGAISIPGAFPLFNFWIAIMISALVGGLVGIAFAGLYLG